MKAKYKYYHWIDQQKGAVLFKFLDGACVEFVWLDRERLSDKTLETNKEQARTYNFIANASPFCVNNITHNQYRAAKSKILRGTYNVGDPVSNLK